jgi:hypothetical protein
MLMARTLFVETDILDEMVYFYTKSTPFELVKEKG